MEVCYRDGLEERALRPRDAAQVEREVHARGRHHRSLGRLLSVEDAEVVDLEAVRKTKRGGVRAHEVFLVRQGLGDAPKQEIGDWLFEEEEGGNGK